jgi:hypothetical protein
VPQAKGVTATVGTFVVLVCAISSIFWFLIIHAGRVQAGGSLFVLALMWAPGVAALLTAGHSPPSRLRVRVGVGRYPVSAPRLRHPRGIHPPGLRRRVGQRPRRRWQPGIRDSRRPRVRLDKVADALRSGSLWTAVIMHASHNLFVQSIFDTFTGDTGRTRYVTGEFGAALPVVLIVAAIVAWRAGKGVELQGQGLVKGLGMSRVVR